MPLPIQALPKGLVGLLDLNTSGVGPSVLSEQLVATMAAEQFYYLPKRQRFTAGPVAAGTAAGSWTFAANPVPSNEVWILLAYTVYALLPITLIAGIQPSYQAPSGGGLLVFSLGPTSRNSTAVVASTLIAKAEGLPLLMSGGFLLGGSTIELGAATAFNAFCTVDYVPFRV